jgi:hypothetical protein
MDEATRVQLARIYATVDALTELEGQDRTMVIEMSQDMISDLIDNGTIAPLADYIAHYCDVIDSREEAEQLAASITARNGA